MATFVDDTDNVAPPRAELLTLTDGSFVLRSPQALGPYARCIGDWLEKWAKDTPDALAVAERAPSGDWRQLTWAQLRAGVGRVAQGLLGLHLPADKPVVVLSDNSVDHLVLMLACMHIGRPVCTVSSAYCRLSKDYVKIREILQMLDPALVYASDAATYGPAIRACLDGGALKGVVVLGTGADEVPGAFPWDTLASRPEGPGVMQAFARLLPDTVAKYLLTSGSTGHPKVAINTHRMLCANQQMMAQTWRFLRREKPVLLDWLPWSHTFGGNHNLNMVLCHGGTLYIDDGRPVPGAIEKTVRNLKDCQPNIHFNVPRGLDMLMGFFEDDLAFAKKVLAPLRAVFYAGAALPQASWQRLQAIAAKVREEPLWLTTSWGSTETAPAVTSAHFMLEGAGCIGLPLPGTELKFIPNGEKLELRVRGVNIFPGYRGQPQLSAEAFDEEGYYKIGDAGFLVDPAHPEKGVMFNGRVAEDFKLTTGTWVSVGTLRVKLVSALAPLATDAVITGHDRDEIGALLFLSPAGQAMEREALHAKVQAALQELKRGGGSSQCPARVLLMTEPPNADAGEITDKGYINQRAVLSRRAVEVATLYAETIDARVVALGH
ncbi:feruloyl-CoA synthase [Ideonella sp. 4Y11]|uniref:Feruloyl-CoA synthase n=1 Tax=Ideonella aquatica TaxID=2824119 RepID=A0A940YRE2_9BURK|nr:feruloyl-CoA synthase [Ideonella aquatica]MBQ0958045.1 feruloyl-CoA synthase [Ideonella aquatica]